MHSINKDIDFLNAVIDGKEPQVSIFYKSYDNLVWELATRWHATIYKLSKGMYELGDVHNELWAYIFREIHKCNLSRSGLSSWIYIVCESKLGMMKRSFLTNRNSLIKNEVNFSLNSLADNNNANYSDIEYISLIRDDIDVANYVSEQEKLLDFIYLTLELIDACTDKERVVYLLKIKGKTHSEIAEIAEVSKTYIPKIFKRLSKKFKNLYNSLNSQEYVNKSERDSLAQDLLSRKSVKYISSKYDLEEDTVRICEEMLDIIGVRD